MAKSNIQELPITCMGENENVTRLFNFIEKCLFIKNFPHPTNWVSKEDLKHYQSQGGIYLVKDGRKIIGCLVLNKNIIEILCVDKEFRHSGIGSALIKHIEALLSKDKRKKYIKVWSYLGFNAGEFYIKNGFDGRKGLTSWILQKNIKDNTKSL